MIWRVRVFLFVTCACHFVICTCDIFRTLTFGIARYAFNTTVATFSNQTLTRSEI